MATATNVESYYAAVAAHQGQRQALQAHRAQLGHKARKEGRVFQGCQVGQGNRGQQGLRVSKDYKAQPGPKARKASKAKAVQQVQPDPKALPVRLA